MILATVLATALSVSNPAPAPFAQELPYQQLAEKFLKSKGKTGAPREETTPQAVLSDGFLHAHLGLFEVWAPLDELGNKRAARDFRDLCAALCRAQVEWLEWLGDGAKDGPMLIEGLESTTEWIEDWKVKVITSAARQDQRDVYDLFAIDDELREAADSLAQLIRTRQVLGTSSTEADEESRSVKLVLMPSRKGFVEFIAYGGHQFPGARSGFWVPGMQNWSQFQLGDVEVIALEYASPSAAPGSYTESYDMCSKSPTGMEEQVVQLGLNQLLAHQHGDALPPSLISGLSINLVTQIYNACHSRVDGDTRGKVTSKREVFVRGGQPQGGILPPNSAESRWRQNYGKNHYLPILKQAQKAGAGEAKKRKIKGAKLNSFLLVHDTGNQDYLTRAPLLGPSAGEVEIVPDSVYGDYLEFTRAYQSAFLFWLQHHGERSKKKAAQSFGLFLSRVPKDGAQLGIAGIAEEVYGAPLSDAAASKKSLEGRFLKWVSRQ